MAVLRSLLLVHDEPDAFRSLQETLCQLGIRIWHAHDCAEARRILENRKPIDLVFTDAALPDGTWKDAIRLANELAGAAPVIVMSRFVNVPLYLDTQDSGAADFIVPPISARDLEYVLTVAMSRTIRRVWAPARHREAGRPVRGLSRDSSIAHTVVEQSPCD